MQVLNKEFPWCHKELALCHYGTLHHQNHRHLASLLPLSSVGCFIAPFKEIHREAHGQIQAVKVVNCCRLYECTALSFNFCILSLHLCICVMRVFLLEHKVMSP